MPVKNAWNYEALSLEDYKMLMLKPATDAESPVYLCQITTCVTASRELTECNMPVAYTYYSSPERKK